MMMVVKFCQDSDSIQSSTPGFSRRGPSLRGLPTRPKTGAAMLCLWPSLRRRCQGWSGQAWRSLALGCSRLQVQRASWREEAQHDVGKSGLHGGQGGLAGMDAGHEGSAIVLFCSGSACCREWPRVAISWSSTLTACFSMSQHNLMNNSSTWRASCSSSACHARVSLFSCSRDARRVPLSRATRAPSCGSWPR